MNNHIIIYFRVVLAASVIASCAIGSQTEPVILFDGTKSYSSRSLVNVGPTGPQTIASGDTWTQSLNYSITVPKFAPGVNPTYLFNAQPVYGGHYLKWHNNTDSWLTIRAVGMQFQDNPTPRRFWSQSGDNTNIQRTANFVILFKTNETSNYTFDSTSRLQVNIRQSVDDGDRTTRWVVVADNKTYVSEKTIPLVGSGSNFYSLRNPHAINWSEWPPGADIMFGELSFTVAGNLLVNITHVGLAENAFLDSGVPIRNVAIESFEAF
jgi:hypothetical protein